MKINQELLRKRNQLIIEKRELQYLEGIIAGLQQKAARARHRIELGQRELLNLQQQWIIETGRVEQIKSNTMPSQIEQLAQEFGIDTSEVQAILNQELKGISSYVRKEITYAG